MRVGLFADRLVRGGRTTGVGTYINELARGLAAARSDHDFVLFSTPERGSLPSTYVRGISVEVLPWPRRSVQAAWIVARRPRINRVGGSLDLLHVLVPTVPVPTDRPLVMTIHDLSPIRFPTFFTLKHRALFRLAVDHARRRACRIVTDSEFTRRDVIDLLAVPADRVTAIPLSADEAFAAPPPETVRAVLAEHGVTRPYIVFVGELTRRKRPLALLEAFARVASELPDHTLVFAGQPGLGFDEMLGGVRSHGLEDRVVFTGRVAQASLPALMTGADVFVLPSAYEGFGLPVLEAMQCGTPVIVSDAGSLPEVVGDAGVIVPGGDPDLLAEAIVDVVSDDACRERLVTRGRSRVAEFSWERTARETIEVYEHAA